MSSDDKTQEKIKMILRIVINLAVFCFVCSCALVCFAQPGKAGGYKEVPATDEQVVAAANFAVNIRKESEKAESLKLISIKTAKKQIVAGTNYSLCLEISDADKAEQAVAIVYQNLQQKYKLSSWSLEKCSISEIDFKNYPAEVEKIKDLDRIFKLNVHNHTNEKHLNGATKEGVNFAGHFIFTSWLIPDPEPHTVSAIIDVRDGRMFFPPELAAKSVDAEGKYCHPSPGKDVVEIYHADSRLLIWNGYNAADQRKDEPCGIYYLEWTGTNFKQIKLTENALWKEFEVEPLDVADEKEENPFNGSASFR